MFDSLRDFIQILFVGDQITSAVRKCYTLAEKCIPVATVASDRGMALLSLSGDCKSEMRGFGDASSEAPKIYLKIKHLLDDTKILETIEDCKEMRTMAKDILGHSEEMSSVLEKAIDSLPEDMQDEEEDDQPKTRSILTQTIEDEDDDDTKELLALLSHVDNDIEEVYSSSNQTRGGLDIFTASTMGSKVFEMTNSKGKVATDLFVQMKSLSTVLAELVGSMLAETACCTKIQAAVKSVSTLLRCRKLVRVLVRAGKAVQQLTEALQNLVDTAWKKMNGFFEQFAAAKKLGKFVSDVKGKFKAGKGAFKSFMRKKGRGGSRSRLFGL